MTESAVLLEPILDIVLIPVPLALFSIQISIKLVIILPSSSSILKVTASVVTEIILASHLVSLRRVPPLSRFSLKPS